MNRKLSKREIIFLAVLLQVFVFFAYYKYTQPATSPSSASVPGFKVRSNIEYYPDLTVAFKFRKLPSDDLLKRMTEFKIKFASDHQAYISDISCDDDELKYMMLCDFQATPYSDRIFVDLIGGLNGIYGSDNIDSVIIE